MHGRKVEQRRGHYADIGDLAAGIEQAFEQRVAQAGRAQAAVAAQVDPLAALALQQGSQAAAQVDYVGAQELGIRDAADVVLAKDGWLQHSFSKYHRLWQREVNAGLEAQN